MSYIVSLVVFIFLLLKTGLLPRHVLYMTPRHHFYSESCFRYSILNTSILLCKYEIKIKVRFFYFLFFIYLFAISGITCLVCNSIVNGLIEGALTSILKYSRMHLNLFLNFTENVTLSWNKIK